MLFICPKCDACRLMPPAYHSQNQIVSVIKVYHSQNQIVSVIKVYHSQNQIVSVIKVYHSQNQIVSVIKENQSLPCTSNAFVSC